MDNLDFRALFEQAPGRYLVLSPTFVILAVSDEYLRATLTTRDAIVGRPLFEIFPDNPEDPAADGVRNLRASLERVLATRAVDAMPLQKYDIRRPEENGGGFEERYWSPLNSPVLSAQGEVLHIIHSVDDVTQRYRSERELERAHRFLDSIIENMPAMVFVKDAENLCFVRFNRAGEELVGISREELLGKSDFDLFPRDEAEFFVAKDREVLARGALITIPEEPIQTLWGIRYLQTSKIPIFDEQGAPRYLLGISQDITEAKRAREELLTSYERVAEANRAKTDFLAMMSHELRTPLNSIIGFSELLSDGRFGALNERQDRYIQNVHQSGKHLLSLINDLLDLSKIEAGRLAVALQPCPTRSVISDAIATLQPLAAAKNIRVSLLPVTGPFPTVIADSVRLRQIVYNLLSNAIKFTPSEGSIVLRADPLDQDRVRISVRDTGIGIAAEDVRKLFTPFTQLHRADSQFGGTGLGLALSKQLAELMQGTIGVESTPGQGSLFYIDLPLGPTTTSTVSAAEGVDTKVPLAMIVDDDVAAQELLEVTLRGAGYRTLVVASGEEAIEKARAHKPDVITLDVLLPGIDGWDTLRVLRADESTAQIPVVMVTISSERSKAFAIGAIEHVVKPIDRAKLLEVIARRSFTTKVKQRPVHVLVIDDDPRQLELVRAALEPSGFVVRTEETGTAGLAAALQGPVDLLLLDLVLPDLSGVEVVDALRKDARASTLPILLITGAEISAEDRARLSGDVTAILSKGALDLSALVAEIGRVLRH